MLIMLLGIGLNNVGLAESADTLNGKGDISYEAPYHIPPIYDPVDMTPEHMIKPGKGAKATNMYGPLSLDLLPDFDFATNKLTTQAEWIVGTDLQVSEWLYTDVHGFPGVSWSAPTYQITDERGTLAGWQLYIRQEDEFESPSGHQLHGTILHLPFQTINRFNKGSYDPPTPDLATTYQRQLFAGSGNMLVAKAEPGTGWGVSSIEFLSGYIGSGMERDDVKLFIPAGPKEVDVQYKTTLIWSLMEL